MANIKAILAGGDVSSGATWNGGVVPGIEDTAIVNGLNLVMTHDWACALVTSRVVDGSTDGGQITMSDGVTFTGTVMGGNSANGCFYYAGNAGSTRSRIIGDVYGGTTASRYGVRFVGTGEMEIIGTITGGTTTSAAGFYVNGSSTCNVYVTGSLLGGASTTTAMLVSTPGGICSITGDVTASAATTGSGFAQTNTCNMTTTINGNVTGGGTTGSCGIGAQYSNLTVNGSVYGGTGGTAHGIVVPTSGTITITVTGNVHGGTSTGHGINCTGNGTINFDVGGFVVGGTGMVGASSGIFIQYYAGLRVRGNVYPGYIDTSYGVFVYGATTGVTVDGIVYGNDYGSVGAVSIAPVPGIFNRAAGAVKVCKLQTGAGGVFPVCGAFLIDSSLGDVWIKIAAPSGNLLEFQSPDALSPTYYPDPTDLRAGVTCANGIITGTCAVPPAAATALGVPVDDTVGTAIIQASDLLDTLGSVLTTVLGV